MENKKREKLVKICGLTCLEDINYINEAKPDFVGFVLFYPKSKRNLELEFAKELKSKLNKNIKTVGVTVEPSLEEVEKISQAGFDYVQIHGKIEANILREKLIPIIKAFNVKDLDEFGFYEKNDAIAGFVLDASVPGSGKSFDWNIVSNLPESEKMILLAGGLNPENVKEALEITMLDGADTSSGVERENGNGKDQNKIMEFIKNAKNYK